MKFLKIKLFIITTILSNIFLYSCKREIKADILIENGVVYDGESLIPQSLSIAIQDDKIIYIGDDKSVVVKATKIIDAEGMIVCPGFIDPHTHADRDLNNIETSNNLPFLFQGITTVVVGNDGDSFYSISKYKLLYESQGIGTNAVLMVGHGTIREQVMGNSDQLANEEEIVKMQSLIQQEMDAGAFGMSTGLFYAPGSYSNTDEVISLAKIVSKNNGVYDSHLRDESSYSIGLIPAIKESIEIGRKAKLPIHISHIKCLGVDVWHQSDSIIKIIENAQKEGIEVTADQYPYEASATGLQAAVVPRWAESGGKDSLFWRYTNVKLKSQLLEETRQNITRRGGPEKLLIVRTNNSTFLGKNLLEISESLDLSPEKAVFEILNTGYIGVASFNMNMDDIHNFMKQQWVVTGSDGNTGHPRKYGTFPRKYNTFVKEKHVIDVATFINGSTSKIAEILRIPKRGKLEKGYFADIIIFNPDTFKDKADYKNAFELSEGLEYSIINGKLSIDKGEFTNKLNGKVLTK